MRSTTVLGVFLGIGKALAVRLSESATGIDTCRGAVRSRPVIGSIPLLNDTLARVGAVEAAGSFTCPVTGINPARAQGWGFFDGPPNPPSAYWPTASIIPSGFAISQGLLGNMQIWCGLSSNLLPNGDGTEIFNLDGLGRDYQGCGLLQTVQTAPMVTKNISFALGGTCPTSVATGSSAVTSWATSATPNPQPETCPKSAFVMPKALQGSGVFTGMHGTLLIGDSNATLAQYEWMKHVVCGYNTTDLTQGNYQVMFGAVVADTPVIVDCWWVRVDTTSRTVMLAFGAITDVDRRTGAMTNRTTFTAGQHFKAFVPGSTLVACPANFDRAQVITDWVPAA